jgi:ATP-dependent helicase HrpA
VIPPISFDGSLPIHAQRERIVEALGTSDVVIVSGATGSGKSTQLPKICLGLGRGRAGLIGHTQPRRLAAQSLAARLAVETGGELGGLVGYQVRFVDRTSPRTRVKLMTDGVLLRELERDPLLRRYDTLIVDEAHERSLNVDFLLGVLTRIRRRRTDLKIIVTSATIETERFAAYFDGVPVIDVEGRSYPVEVRYRPLAVEPGEAPSYPDAIAAALVELETDARGLRGDALVFLPGERQIRETQEFLQRAGAPAWEVLPLYSRLSATDQERIFAAHRGRRVILATNVAETSLTVPGLRFVIDTGLARISRYSPRAKFQRLPVEPVSQASAEQRKGRCGREGEGICIRLYSEEDFASRPAYTDPEVRRTNLGSLILQMAALGLGAPEEFPFLDAPDTRLLNDGYRLLQELNAVDGERRITRLGRRMAMLPVDPRLARVLIEGARLGCLPEALVITAFLSIADPRERPADAATAADTKHAGFADERSDFLGVLKLWAAFRGQAESGGSSALRRWCRTNFLSYLRMREWQDLREQLEELTRREPQGPRVEPVPVSVLHQAILSGFLGGIGVLEEPRVYLGARDVRFAIAPGTPLRRRSPRWIVAASLVETSQVLARMVAAVQPSWIEAAGAHMVRRSYSEASWDEARGMAMARETVSLYGRVLSSGRRVPFAKVDPEAARRIFVEEALIGGRSTLHSGFLERNAARRAAIARFEAKLRRRDLLASDAELAGFYLERIGPAISGVRSFERWWAEHARTEPGLLDLPAELVLRQALPDDLEQAYPDTLEIDANRIPLEYVFDPTDEDDGLTLTVPLALLPALDPLRLEWLVPGLVHEKVVAILRGLPRLQRRALVPIPEAAARFLGERPAGEGSLYARLAQFVTRASGDPVDMAALRRQSLPPHLQLQVRVIDTAGRALRCSRDLRAVREAPLRDAGPETADEIERHGLRSWDFGELPDVLQVERNGLQLRLYPALLDRGTAVDLRLLARRAAAEAHTRDGVMRLAALAMPQQHGYVRRLCAEDRELALLVAAAGFGRKVLEAIADRAVATALAAGPEPRPRSPEAFALAVEAARGAVAGHADEIAQIVRACLDAARELRARLGLLAGEPFADARAEVEAWLARVLPEDFVRATPEPWFAQLPKYLRGQARRVEKLRGNLPRDAELARRLRPYAQAVARLAGSRREEADPDAVERLRWGLEEYRLSLHAQELRTLAPISAQRLDKLLAEISR